VKIRFEFGVNEIRRIGPVHSKNRDTTRKALPVQLSAIAPEGGRQTLPQTGEPLGGPVIGHGNG
jgi:hypothetical protein